MEGFLFFSQENGKGHNNQMEKEMIFMAANVGEMFQVRERYMMAALCRKGNMVQEEMVVWMHMKMKIWN